MVGVRIRDISVIVEFLLAAKRFIAFGLISKDKISAFKLLRIREAGNCTFQKLNPFAVSTTL